MSIKRDNSYCSILYKGRIPPQYYTKGEYLHGKSENTKGATISFHVKRKLTTIFFLLLQNFVFSKGIKDRMLFVTNQIIKDRMLFVTNYHNITKHETCKQNNFTNHG